MGKLENVVLVDVYNCLYVYQYFSRYEVYTFFEQHSLLFSSKLFSFSHNLTIPIVGSTFELTGLYDLIGSSGSVEIFVVPSSTAGSKAYFLFKLHDPTSINCN